NSLFHRASAQGESAEALFEAKWRPFEADTFWKADAPGARPKRPRMDHFLSHALSAQTGQATSLRELYAEYRAFTRPKGKMRFDTVEKELGALVAFAPTYRTLEEGGGDPGLAALGAKLCIWQVTTAYPLVFCIAASDAPGTVKQHLYNLIYAYVVRRMICGLPPERFNLSFADLVRPMLDRGVSLETFASAFATQTGPAVRFPSDEEFRRAIHRNPLYEWLSRKERLIDILWELECASRTKYSVNTPRPESMSIEHVLPQSWTATWPLPDGRYAPADASTGADGPMLAAIEARQSALHTLGNLTLITVPANAAASNAAFPKKAQWLKQSLLALNLAILEKSAWGEREITERGNALADLAVKIWPSPTSA
ncbi:MAG: HNH endonuclease, partial [Acetobacteraceae bacterium]|nr:HNH endonuclease [Acetobacteraceae bacterium]